MEMENTKGLEFRDGEIDSLRHLTGTDEGGRPDDSDFVLLHKILVPDRKPFEILICRIRGQQDIFSDELEYFERLRPDHLEWLRQARYGYALRKLDWQRRVEQARLDAVKRAEILLGQEALKDRLAAAQRIESGGSSDFHRPAAEALVEEKRSVSGRGSD
ncbi:hypothetical protein SAE02_61740 [Skermanella aerolata]|uniref:Uncharacterized protein n=1 Tax=Skermanella aerolata TaxID=393310 RepID=A0A512DZX0_9PROT|nr:hypothetical protein [Skermanella aerolata]KJB91867.1 hypothetical protein N826_25460 [Skermanella aerolata KACC 11604]GEO42026.1 hypothetical protein SAE02_61740 [Skermanella aerolata]